MLIRILLTIARFRWVACQLDYLCDFSSDFERREALGQLAPTLHETYLRLLKRFRTLPTPTQSKIQMCLQFIAFCPDKLTIGQLREIISTPERVGSFLNDDNLVSEDRIASMCGSLLKKSADGMCFEFAHFSVREFLEHQSLVDTPDLEYFRISQSKCYKLLATQSLRYLQLSNFIVDLPGLENSRKHVLTDSIGKDEGYGFHLWASKYALQMMSHDDPPSIFHGLMHSLFEPSKTSCLVLFAISLYVSIVGECIRTGLITGDPGDLIRGFTKRVASDDFQPIHLAAALNLPNVCEYLISTGSDPSIRSSFGTPFELSVASFLRFNLEGCESTSLKAHYHHLLGPIQELLPSGTQRNSTVEIFESASSEELISDQPLISEDTCMLFSTCIIAFVQNDFRVLQRLFSRGMTLKDSIFIAEFRKLLCQSLGSIERDEQPLLGFLQHISNALEPEPGWQLEIGRVIWNAAVNLGLSFTRDPTVADFRITFSKEALITRAFVTIKSHDLQGLQECLADGRLDLSERYQNPRQQLLEGTTHYLTLLHFAVLEDNLQATIHLAQAGCDPNIRSVLFDYSWPPIHDCSSIHIFDELLAYGAQATDVETSSGHNIWHCYASKAELDINFFDSLAKRYPSETAQALLTKSKDGETPLQRALLLTFPPLPREDYADRVMALIEFCDEVAEFWSRHEPLFGMAANFGSERVINRLIETGARLDPVGPSSKTPLHCIGIESSSASVQYLNELYPEALDMRFEGRLPLQLYLERCSRHEHPIEDDVAERLFSTGSLESIDGEGTSLWEYYCRSCLTRRDTEGLSNDQGHRFIWSWLLRNQPAMQVYQNTTGRNGLGLIFSSLITLDNIQDIETLVPPHALTQAIESSCHWASAKNEPSVLRFLQFSIRNRWYSLIYVLLEHGVSVSEVVDHYSPVQFACQPPLAIALCSAADGKEVLCKMLDLADAVHLNDYGKDGLTILHRLATTEVQVSQLRWLIEKLLTKGVDINKISLDEAVSTPIAHHIRHHSISCAELLLQLGADPGMATWPNPGAAMEASFRGFRAFLDKSLETSKIQGTFVDWTRMINFQMMAPDNQTLQLYNANVVHLTSWGGHVECMAFYVDNNLIDDLDMPSSLGWTAMHVAALQGWTPMIEYLSSKGCKILSSTANKLTPLHIAVQQRHYDACKSLIRLGALDIPDATGMTPTMLAAKGDDKVMLRVLREMSSTEVDIPQQFDGSLHRKPPKALIKALEEAIGSGDIEECKRLCALGCPVNINIKGWSPLGLALDSRHVDIADWLLENGGMTTQWICQNVNDGEHFNVIDLCSVDTKLGELLPMLVDKCIRDGSGWPLLDNHSLVSAIRNENTEGLSTLLKLLDERALEIR